DLQSEAATSGKDRLASLVDFASRLADSGIQEVDSSLLEVRRPSTAASVAGDELADLEARLADCAERLRRRADQLAELASAAGNRRARLAAAEAELKSLRAPRPSLETKLAQLDGLRALARRLDDADDNAAAGAVIVDDVDSRSRRLRRDVADAVDEATARVADHRAWAERAAALSDWLSEAERELAEAADAPEADRESIANKAELARTVAETLPDGETLAMQAAGAADRALTGTAPAGRDEIRAELRDLRRRFDAWCEASAELRRRLEAAGLQWSDYDESYQRLVAWLKEAEFAATGDFPLQPGLPEKRSQLHFHRSRLHDIRTREPVLEALIRRGQQLASPHVANKLAQLSARYRDLADSSAGAVRHCEQVFESHLAYQDAFQLAADWLHSANERLARCESAGESSDADPSTSGLSDSPSDLVDAALPDSETKTSAALKLGEAVLTETAESGRPAVQREMDWLDRGVQAVRERCQDLQARLRQRLADSREFESEYERLYKLLREAEAEAASLTSAIAADAAGKRQLAEQISSMADRLSGDEPAFSSLRELADRRDNRASQRAAALCARLIRLRTGLRESAAAQLRRAGEHEAFDESARQLGQSLDEAGADLNAILRRSQPATTEEAEETLAELAGVRDRLGDVELQCDRLSAAVDRIAPATSAEGRAAAHELCSNLRQTYSQLAEQAAQAAASLESSCQSLNSYKLALAQAEQWLAASESRLVDVYGENDSGRGGDTADLRARLHSLRAFQQDLVSSGRLRIDQQLIDRFGAEDTDNPEIRQLQRRRDDLLDRCGKLIDRRQADLARRAERQEARAVWLDWLTGARSVLAAANSTGGGEDQRTALQLRRDKLEELLASLPDGQAALNRLAELDGGDSEDGEVAEGQSELDSLEKSSSAGADAARQSLERLLEVESAVESFNSRLRSLELQARGGGVSGGNEAAASAVEKVRLADKFEALLD
uniref:Non-specific serine/threonine protein kinase n=1 Tax=Macrostomum lignano TaxID=282301 RepID=A0A1I8GCG5_9PLAT